MSKFLAIAVVLAASAPGLVVAQGVTLKPDDVIAARQGGMALMGASADAIKAGVQSGADVKVYAETADAMSKWAMAYPALFPDGTQMGHNTKAKPEIWQNKADFDKLAANFVAAAQKLEEVAKTGDKAAFAAQFTTTTQGCGACHRNYKER